MTTIMELLKKLEEELEYSTYLGTYQIGIALEVIRDRVEDKEFDKVTEIRNKIFDKQ